jgi:hypothetical protein
MQRLLPVLALALSLAACASAGRNKLAWISLGGSGPCTVELDKRRFIIPGQEALLAAESRRIAGTGRGAIISTSPAGLSFGCYRAAMAILDQARFPRMGFVSDLVPDE